MWFRNFLRKLLGRQNPPSEPKKYDPPAPNVSVPLLCGDEIQTTASATATIINPDKGLLLTARHAIEKCTQFMFRYQGTWFLADLVYADPENDLALLATSPEALRDAPRLQWKIGVTADEKVAIRGYVRSHEDSKEAFKLKRITGKITGASENWGWEITQDTNDPESHEGMSGSPVLDQDNKLVGIYTHCGRSFLYATCPRGNLLQKIEECSTPYI